MKKMKRNTFLQKCKIGMLLALLTVIVTVIKPPAKAFAFQVTPIEMVEMYSTSATPVYATPDLFSPVVVYLNRFTNVRVLALQTMDFSGGFERHLLYTWTIYGGSN